MERSGPRDGADGVDPRALEGFVRALIGVRDAAVETGPDGRLRALHVVPAPGATDRQVRLNVVSALMAGPGVTLDPATLRIGSSLPGPGKDARALPQETNETAKHAATNGRAAHGPAASGTPASANGGPPAPAPAPPDAGGHAGGTAGEAGGAGRARLVRFDLARPAAGRVRVVAEVVVEGRGSGAGVREADDRPGAALELAAAAVADALRAAGGAPLPFQLGGIAVTEIGGRPHVVVAVDVWKDGRFEPRPGAAAVTDTYELAAACAVLAASFRY